MTVSFGGDLDDWKPEAESLAKSMAEECKKRIVQAVFEERERCAKIAELILECYLEHGQDCECAGFKMPLPNDIPKRIRGGS